MISQPDRENNVAEYACKKVDKLHQDRSNWESHWTDTAEYFLPKKDNIYGSSVRGEKKHNMLYDSTSVHVMGLLAAALHGMLTNPTGVWFGLTTGDDETDSLDEVSAWLQDSSRR